MIALLLLRAPAGRYALRVGDTAGVRAHEALTALPTPLPGVAGLLPADARDADRAPLPVLAPFGEEGAHVVVVVPATGTRFGLLVGSVEGVVRIDGADLLAAPGGQAEPLVTAVAGGAAHGALLLDSSQLAARLAPRPR